MSSRSLRKLQGRDAELQKLANLGSESQSSEEEESLSNKQIVNHFTLLKDSDAASEGDHEEIADTISHKTDQIKKSKRKNRKKNSNKKNAQQQAPKPAFEDIDKILDEMNIRTPVAAPKKQTLKKKEKYILAVEHKFLNPTNELKKIFGARTLMHDRRHNNVQSSRGTWLVSPDQRWPRLTKTGLSMDLIASSGKNSEFAYVHSRDYKEVQFKFLDSVLSHDHNQISEVLKLNPYHIDSLITLAEMFRMNDDSQTARDLTERGLYSLESHFHSKFNISSGKCSLTYRRPENRAMFLLLYRHLHFVSQRGCHRTALELCKVLFNLNSDEDPLCVLLFMDYFAIQAAEYKFAKDFCNEFKDYKNLLDLPNWAYSTALANFELFQMSQDDMDLKETADELLQEALLKFPFVLLPLLDKCSIEPDTSVSQNPFFTTEARNTSPGGLKLLCTMFATRNSSQWKAPEVMSWLETNVQMVLKRLKETPKLNQTFRAKRERCYQKPPLNIYRYAKISEIQGISEFIPPDIHLKAVLSYDPLPPIDPIITYEKPQRPSTNNNTRSENPFGLFLHSLLPNFNAEEAAAAAAAGQDEDFLARTNDALRDQIQNLMGAMRNLFGNMDAVQPPGQDENPQDHPDDPQFHEDEWD